MYLVTKALQNFIHITCGLPGDSRSWESPEKADNIWQLFIQILLR